MGVGVRLRVGVGVRVRVGVAATCSPGILMWVSRCVSYAVSVKVFLPTLCMATGIVLRPQPAARSTAPQPDRPPVACARRIMRCASAALKPLASSCVAIRSSLPRTSWSLTLAYGNGGGGSRGCCGLGSLGWTPGLAASLLSLVIAKLVIVAKPSRVMSITILPSPLRPKRGAGCAFSMSLMLLVSR